MHLVRHGYHVRLLTDTGANVASAAHDASGVGSDFEGALLDALAVIAALGATTACATRATALRRGGGDGLLVAVLGALDPEEAPAAGPAPARLDRRPSPSCSTPRPGT